MAEHNHVTRDIKGPGICPGCDERRDKVKAATDENRLIDQRARRRATQRLIEAHRAEYDALMEECRREAETEAKVLAAAAVLKAEGHAHTTPAPPRLLPGRRLEGQQPVDRLDVARCELCIKSHDRGHACPKCGAQPKRDPAGLSREVHRLADAGTKMEIIATTLRIPPDHVERLLEAPVF